MLDPFIAATALGTAASSAAGASSSSAGWMLLQVFIVFCITLGGLAWLARRNT